jgi:hypothetical protein
MAVEAAPEAEAPLVDQVARRRPGNLRVATTPATGATVDAAVAVDAAAMAVVARVVQAPRSSA